MSHNDNQKKNNNRRLFKEKVLEGWHEFVYQATLWVEDIISNKKKLIPIVIVLFIGIFAFIRGVYLHLFY
jgi:hypothetical protein